VGVDVFDDFAFSFATGYKDLPAFCLLIVFEQNWYMQSVLLIGALIFFQIEPPAGWSFEPKEVILNVDGITDQCSQGKDINFVFKGFTVTGKVSKICSKSSQ
jgi:hypothetical protein